VQLVPLAHGEWLWGFLPRGKGKALEFAGVKGGRTAGPCSENVEPSIIRNQG